MRLTTSLAFVIAILAAGASGAAAQVPAGTCAVEGFVQTTADPSQPGGPTGVQAIVPDAQNGGNPFNDTDTGTYAGTLLARCATGTTVRPGVIETAGRYENNVCGTGVAEGDGTTDVDLVPNPDIVDIDYRIEFSDGLGKMEITSGTYGGGPIVGDGYVAIAPTAGNCVTSDVTRFEVEGALSFHLAP